MGVRCIQVCRCIKRKVGAYIENTINVQRMVDFRFFFVASVYRINKNKTNAYTFLGHYWLDDALALFGL